MAKNKRTTPARDCRCDKCSTVAHAIPGRPHRRCSGHDGQPIKAKHTRAVTRGTWQGV